MEQSTTTASHSAVQELANGLQLTEKAYYRALQLAHLTPEKSDWHRYVSRFLVAVGVLLIVAGVTAFFAWNWADLAYAIKFALIQAGIAATAVMAWRFGLDSIGGRACLFSSAFLVGALLAVFGQVYQTGADPYGLFLGWAVLILPWVIIGRQAALWILLQVLLNLALIMYWTQVIDPPDGWWELTRLLGPLVWLTSTLMNSTLASLVFALNVTALIAWEFATSRGSGWVQGRTYPRIMAFGALVNVMIPTIIIVFGASFEFAGDVGVISPVLYTAASIAGFVYYQYRQQDLLILTMVLFAAILVVTTLFVRYLAESPAGILMLAILLIGQVAGAAAWLRSVSGKWAEKS